VSETQLSKAIRDALATMGVWVIRSQVKGRTGKRSVATGEPGQPDLYLPALNAHIEVKVGGGKLSAAQIAWHSRAAKHGVRVAVVRTVSQAIGIVRMWKHEVTHERSMGWR
jgi:hypothetical protein